jgi:hypothetical protein
MTQKHNLIAATLTALTLLLSTAALRAQDPPMPDPAAAAPVDAPAAAVPGAAATPAPATVPALPQPPDPAVDTIVDSNPKTPAELLRAAAILVDLNRPDLAKKYLQQMAATPADEKSLADAALQLDPAALMRLAVNKDLQPEARTLVDAVMAAGAKASRNPQRLQVEINQLNDPSPAVRREAMSKILAAHDDAVPSLVVALGDPNRAQLFPKIEEALMGIGAQAVPPLSAALLSDNPYQVKNVIRALDRIGSRDAVIFLVGPATAEHYPPEVRQAARAALADLLGIKDPTPKDAITLLRSNVERILNNERPVMVNGEGKVEQWYWDPTIKAPVKEAVPVSVAVASQAARLASDLLALDPQNPKVTQLFLISTLDELAGRTPPDAPLDMNSPVVKRAIALGPAKIEDALSAAMSRDRLDGARAMAEILGNIGNASLLGATDGEVRPLVRAVAQGDRRLRFAAAEAIMKFKPQVQFAGSSHLMGALVFLADSPGVRRAVVAFPTERIGMQLSTLLGSLGYEVDWISDGHKCLLQSQCSGDYELILLTGRIDHAPVWVTIQQLRHEPASARLPIGLMAEPGDIPYLESVASEDGSNRSPPRSRMTTELDGGIDKALPDSEFGDGSLTTVFERPTTPEAMKFFVDRLVAKAGGYVVSPSVRQKQALAALGWLKQLNEANPVVFALRPYETTLLRTLENSITSTGAATLLAMIGSHHAQQALLDLSNNSAKPLELRQAAAAAFSQAVRTRGIQLTSREIEDQYVRYNLSATEEPAVQQLLALILDAIEAPTRAVREKASLPTPLTQALN